jgi:hypothetical protein
MPFALNETGGPGNLRGNEILFCRNRDFPDGACGRPFT